MKNDYELGKAKDKDLTTSLAAMKRAAAMARNTAVQTDTAIVVVRGEKIVRVTSDDLRCSAPYPYIETVQQGQDGERARP